VPEIGARYVVAGVVQNRAPATTWKVNVKQNDVGFVLGNPGNRRLDIDAEPTMSNSPDNSVRRPDKIIS